MSANAAAALPSAMPLLPGKPSLAVVPFQNMSCDLEQEYFADGMVEEIITAFSRNWVRAMYWKVQRAKKMCSTFRTRWLSALSTSSDRPYKRPRSAARPTHDLTAYDLYLRALAHSLSYKKNQIVEALDLLGHAIGRDPHYGPALALAAHFHRTFEVMGCAEAPETARHTSINLDRQVLRIGPDDPEVPAARSPSLERQESAHLPRSRGFSAKVPSPNP